MAPGPVALRRAAPIGLLATAFVVAALILPLAAVLWRGGGGASLSAADWSAVRFTLTQAALSALVSTLLAVPVARALARRRFRGRGAMISLMGAPFILPVIVAVTGLLMVFGRGGVLNGALTAVGLPPVSIYGLHGVVLAHVFFNLPLAVRLILQAWSEIPGERFRLAAQLGADAAAIQRLLEWPMLRRTLPGVAAVIFAICLGSFAVALTLGGGPRSTTVELAIYQAFRFDFDPARAALLSIVQFALVAAAGLVALRLSRGEGFGAGLDRVQQRWDAGRPGLIAADAAWLILAAILLLGPLAMLALRGAAGLAALPASTWLAVGNSLAVSLGATVLTMALALAMACARRDWVELAGLAPLATSPLVVGTGLFVLIHPVARVADWALVVTMGVNVLMALPFALRILAPAARGVERDFGRLADSLDLRGAARLRWLILPRMRRPLGFAAGLTAALSMGDLGVIALFADQDRVTLPLLVWRLIGAYRMEAAAGASLLLLLLSFALFLLFDLTGRADADA